MATFVLALVGAGLKGAAIETGEFAMSRLLDAVFGSSGDTQAIQNDLQSVSQQLTQINTALAQIEKEIGSLEQTLAIDTEKVETYVGEAGILPAISVIQTHYGTTPQQGLQWFVNQGLSGEDESGSVASFAQNVFGAWDIPSQVQTISDGVATVHIGTDQGLLNVWTDLFISMMGTQGYSSNLYNFYLTLESYFQELLVYQLQGVAILTNSYCYQCDLNSSCPNGQSYLQNTFGQLLEKQVEMFLYCVEKMVLSQWNMATSMQQNGGAIELPEVSQQVFTRADLFAATLLAGAGLRPMVAGLYGRALCRPSAIKNNQGPSLQPSGYTASTGTIVPLSTGYKTVDWVTSTDAFPQLQSYADSDIVVVRYYWPWPATPPPAGQPIDPNFEGGVAPGYYDEYTLQPVTSPSATQDPTVLVADFTDVSEVYADPYFTDLVGNFNGWSFGSLSASSSLATVTSKSGELTSMPLSAQVTINSEYDYTNSTLNVYLPLTGPLFKYSGTVEPLTMVMGCSGGYSVVCEEHGSYHTYYTAVEPYMVAKMTPSSVQVFDTQTGAGLSSAWPNTLGQTNPAPYQTNFQTTTHFSPQTGNTTLEIDFNESWKGKDPGSATSNITINYIRFAWALPAVTPP